MEENKTLAIAMLISERLIPDWEVDSAKFQSPRRIPERPILLRQYDALGSSNEHQGCKN